MRLCALSSPPRRRRRSTAGRQPGPCAFPRCIHAYRRRRPGRHCPSCGGFLARAARRCRKCGMLFAPPVEPAVQLPLWPSA